jgi:hypothetical protein
MVTARRIPSRLFRTAAVTCALISLAAGAHLMAGGALPAPMITMAIVALTALPVMVLSRIRMSLPLMAGLMAASQLALHSVFSALSAASSFTVGAEHLHATQAMLMPPMSAALPPMSGALMPGGVMPEQMIPGGMSIASPVPMLVFHIVAAALTTLMLAKGEAALWALAGWLRPLVSLPETVSLQPPAVIPVHDADFVPRRPGSLRLPALRGPPVSATAVV